LRWIKLCVSGLRTCIKFWIVFIFINKIWWVTQFIVISNLFFFTKIQFLAINPCFAGKLLFNRMACPLFDFWVMILVYVFVQDFLNLFINPDLTTVFILLLMQDVLLSYWDFCFFNIVIFFWCLFIFILFLNIFIFISSEILVFLRLIGRLLEMVGVSWVLPAWLSLVYSLRIWINSHASVFFFMDVLRSIQFLNYLIFHILFLFYHFNNWISFKLFLFIILYLQ
jgi:hypothetical protein